jgi:hypothetical protein
MTFQGNYSNDKPDLREPIPAGTLLFLRMSYTPGGAGTEAECGAGSAGALTASKPPSDTKYLKAEFTVLRGPYKGRKFWSNLTVSGGQVDEKGNSKAGGITRQAIRLILDSSQGLNPKDESPEAMAKRVITGYRDLQGRTFVAKAKIEPAQNGYPAKNGLGQVMAPGMTGMPSDPAELAALLDNPAVAATTAAAPAAPVWGQTTTAPAAAPVADQANASQSSQQAQATQPAQTGTAENSSALPDWARAAA